MLKANYDESFITMIVIEEKEDREMNVYYEVFIDITLDGINSEIELNTIWYGSKDDLEKLIDDTFCNANIDWC